MMAATCNMGHRDLPTREVIVRDAQLLWRICGMGICVEHASGHLAQAEFNQQCRDRGIAVPRWNGPPERGPSDVDEPGL